MEGVNYFNAPQFSFSMPVDMGTAARSRLRTLCEPEYEVCFVGETQKVYCIARGPFLEESLAGFTHLRLNGCLLEERPN